MPWKQPDSIHAFVATTFTTALVEGRDADAHAMLAPGLAGKYTAESLGAAFREMIEYGDSPPLSTELVTTLEDWPDRELGDYGWAYVAVMGDGFSEAVTVVVTDHDGRPAIRYLEWGRP